MREIISLKENNCKDCYKCIRACAVKAISFAENQARIIPEECVLCGTCYVVCPQNAKEIRPDVARVKAAIAAGRRVAASVAPSFIADFDVGSLADMRAALERLGFSSVSETARGAQAVSQAYAALMREGAQKVYISSCCPAVNLLVRKHYPALLGFLAPVATPMQADCAALRAQDPEAFTVFIGPCIAKKQEADESALVDAALTFDELRAWLAEAGVALTKTPPPEGEGALARQYPVTGGILKATEKVAPYRRVAVDGLDNCRRMLEELAEGVEGRVFIEMSACEGGCVAGPCTQTHGRRPLRGTLRVDAFAGAGAFSQEIPAAPAAHHTPLPIANVQPGHAAIEQVLRKMGKTSAEKELNCGCCGYATCREKAAAVCQGKAVIDMCLPYLMEKAQSFSDQIIANTPNAIFVLSEELIVQQINDAAVRMFGLKRAEDILHAPIVRLLDPADYAQAVNSAQSVYNRRRFIPEYQLTVVETILYDRAHRILISIMRDVTEREQHKEQQRALREQTIEITDKVIDKQMRVVQEIASLLGETTAETKLALTKLKDAMTHE